MERVKRGDWMLYTDDLDQIHVKCSNCGWEVPSGQEIPDICPVCHSDNMSPEEREH